MKWASENHTHNTESDKLFQYINARKHIKVIQNNNINLKQWQ